MKQETKRIALVTLWCLAAVVLLVGVGWIGYYFYQFPTYHNNQYRLSVKYPRDWQKMEQVGGVVVAFVRPKQTAMDIFEPNFNITVQEAPDKIATLTSFSETITKQMKAVFKKTINILEDKECTFANRRGHRLVLLASPDNIKAEFVWTIKGSLAYIFTFMAREKQFKELSPAIDAIVESFKFD